jgi:hypothetical protein
VDEVRSGGLEIEDEEGHADGENSVGDGGDAIEVSTGDAVVVDGHGDRITPWSTVMLSNMGHPVYLVRGLVISSR